MASKAAVFRKIGGNGTSASAPTLQPFLLFLARKASFWPLVIGYGQDLQLSHITQCISRFFSKDSIVIVL